MTVVERLQYFATGKITVETFRQIVPVREFINYIERVRINYIGKVGGVVISNPELPPQYLWKTRDEAKVAAVAFQNKKIEELKQC